MTARARATVAVPLPTRPRRSLRLLPTPAVRSTRRRRRWVLVALSLIAAFFAVIYSRIALDRSAFVQNEIERSISIEEARYWELRLEVTELQAPDRIAGVAEEMGLVFPDQVLTVSVPGLGDPGPGIEERWVDLKALLSAQR